MYLRIVNSDKLKRIKMPQYKTHTQCKEKLIDLLKYTLNQIDEIDSETVYSITEPNWWLEMQDLKREINKSLIIIVK